VPGDSFFLQVYTGIFLSFIPSCTALHGGAFFDPRFDYFVRRKESQNCEFGDCAFRLIALQSSIIKGLQRVKKCSRKNTTSSWGKILLFLFDQ
jgi:hypothetical protein